MPRLSDAALQRLAGHQLDPGVARPCGGFHMQGPLRVGEGADRGHDGFHRRLNFLGAQTLGQVDLQHFDFCALDVGQVLTLRGEVRRHRVFALFDEFVDDGDHHGVVEFHTLIHLFLFHRGLQQANGAQTRAVFGTHGCFHVFGDLCFEAHTRLLSRRKKNRKKSSLRRP